MRIEGSNITIFAEETCAIDFIFTNVNNGAPWVISNLEEGYKDYIVFAVAKSELSTIPNNVLEYEFELSGDNDDVFWHRFNTNEWVDFIGGYADPKNENDWGAGTPKNTPIRYKYEPNNTITYGWIDDQYTWHDYDFKNSLITVNIDRDDYKQLNNIKHKYEIAYIIKDKNDKIVYKQTLVSPSNLIVEGAII